MFGSSDDDDVAKPSSTQAAAPKRSLFNRPAWAKPQVTEAQDSDTGDIFSHSTRLYTEIVADQERKKRQKDEKKKDKAKVRQERRTSAGKSEVKQESAEGGTAKKRRITAEEGLSLLGDSFPSPPLLARDDDRDDYAEPNSWQPSASARPTSRVHEERRNMGDVGTRSCRRTPSAVIDLGDSDDDDVIQVAAPPELSKENGEDESDDEFAELARVARQRRKLEERQPSRTATPVLNGDRPKSGSLGGHADASHNGRTELPAAPDPVIHILINSRIPNSKPLIVSRKLSQRLQDVRLVWCEKQKFSAEMTKEVFFIYRMRRLYDVTTCKSLGLDVDAYGNVFLKGAEGMEGVEKIIVDAVTEEIFLQMKEDKAKEERAKANPRLYAEEQAAASAAADSAAGANGASEETSYVRIVLKAKDRPDFKLKVKPTTLISKIMSASRKTFVVEEGRNLFLEFDGERLEPEHQLQDTEISDMDCVDVHIV